MFNYQAVAISTSNVDYVASRDSIISAINREATAGNRFVKLNVRSGFFSSIEEHLMKLGYGVKLIGPINYDDYKANTHIVVTW